MTAVLGIDVGGTKLAVGVVTGDGRLLAWRREAARAEPPEATIERLVAMSRAALDEAGIGAEQLAATGVGCGGPLDAEAGLIISPPNLPGWVDVPLVALLAASLGEPVHLENDANAAALGELRFGAGRGVRHLVYLTISTGIGGGVIVDGRLLSGANGNAAELGHMSVCYDGWPCSCGRRGCLEAFASGTNIAARAGRALDDGPASELRTLAGDGPVTAATVVAGVRRGDALAVRIWDETVAVLAAGLTNILNIFNPQRIVLGGGVTDAGELLFEPLRRLALPATLGSQGEVADIVPAELGERIGVYGAAAVALERLEAVPEVAA